jgi:hypothetical protein
LVAKAFINNLKEVFSTISNQKYVIEMPTKVIENGELKDDKVVFGLPGVFSKNEDYREKIRKKLDKIYKENHNYFLIFIYILIFNLIEIYTIYKTSYY